MIAQEQQTTDQTEPRKPIPISRKLIYSAVASCLALAVLLGTAELVVRLLGTGYETSFFVPSGGGQLTTNPRFPWRYFGKSVQPRTTNIVHLPQKKPPGTYRIFVLGGSAAMGVPSPDFSFSRFLEVMLAEAYPEQQFEVINAALTAVNSHVVRDIAQECASYEPDLFIVYLGNNEVVGPFGPASVFEAVASNLGAIRASLALKTTHLGQWLLEVFGGDRGPADWEGMQMFLDREVAADDPRLERVYRQFAENLSVICQAAMRAGARVLLCTVAVNLKDCPPFSTTGQVDPPFINQVAGGRQEGWEPFDPRWIEPLKERLEVEPQNALLHYLLGRCYLRAAERQRAGEQLATARDLDLLRFRADARINDTIRELAGSETIGGVDLVDVEQTFAQNAAEGISGGEQFFEHVYFNLQGQYQLARVLFDAVVGQLPERIQAASAPLPPPASFEACGRDLALTSLERWGVIKEALDLMDKPPFIGQLGHEQRAAAQRANVTRLEEALSTESDRLGQVYLAAVARNPSDLVLRKLAGRFLLSSDRAEEALGHFRAIEAELPENHRTHLLLGQAFYAGGAYRKADESFKKAISLAADPADLLSEAADFYAREGEWSVALDYARRAHALRPDRVSTMKLLARIQLRSNRVGEAFRLLRRIEKLRPGDPEVLRQLAVLSLQGGDSGQAVAYAERGLQLQPENLPLRNLYAVALQNLGKLDEAAAEYEAVLSTAPEQQQVLKQYFRLLRRLGRDADALAWCLQRPAEEREKGPLLEQVALLRATSRDAAVYDPQRALELAKKLNLLVATPDVQALNVLAIAQAEMGDFAAAAGTVQKGLTLVREQGNQRATAQLERQLRLIQEQKKPSQGPR
jgi:tetratricopeptide (TPR) repeat protein